jgi:hypothetical protein
LRTFFFITGIILSVLTCILSYRAWLFIREGKIAKAYVFGLNFRIEDQKEYGLKVLEMGLISRVPGEMIMEAVSCTQDPDAGPCFPVVAFQPSGHSVIWKQFNCRGTERYIQGWGFPLSFMCDRGERNSLFWDRVTILHDEKDPNKFRFDSLLSVCVEPLIAMALSISCFVLYSALALAARVGTRT